MDHPRHSRDARLGGRRFGSVIPHPDGLHALRGIGDLDHLGVTSIGRGAPGKLEIARQDERCSSNEQKSTQAKDEESGSPRSRRAWLPGGGARRIREIDGSSCARNRDSNQSRSLRWLLGFRVRSRVGRAIFQTLPIAADDGATTSRIPAGGVVGVAALRTQQSALTYREGAPAMRANAFPIFDRSSAALWDSRAFVVHGGSDDAVLIFLRAGR